MMTMQTYRMTHYFDEDDTFTVTADDDIIVNTTHPGGMDWVNTMTWRYGGPFLGGLMHATVNMYLTTPEDEQVTKEVAEFEIEKSDPELKQVFGWAYVMTTKDGQQVVDRSGEMIESVAELEKAATGFMLTSRTQGDRHARVGVGTMIESVVFTPEKIEKMGLPPGSLPTGWWVGFQVNDDAWEDVKSGRKQFSIHGKGVKKKVTA